MAIRYPKSLMQSKGLISVELTDRDVSEDKELQKDLITINQKIKSEILRDSEQMLGIEEMGDIRFR